MSRQTFSVSRRRGCARAPALSFARVRSDGIGRLREELVTGEGDPRLTSASARKSVPTTLWQRTPGNQSPALAGLSVLTKRPHGMVRKKRCDPSDALERGENVLAPRGASEHAEPARTRVWRRGARRRRIKVTGYEALADVYEWLMPDSKLTPAGSVAAFADVVQSLPPNARVLDCSCGTGQLAVGLSLDPPLR